LQAFWPKLCTSFFPGTVCSPMATACFPLVITCSSMVCLYKLLSSWVLRALRWILHAFPWEFVLLHGYGMFSCVLHALPSLSFTIWLPK
jgi:hypothetical protein